MEARVNQSSRYGTITAFSGREYVKYEWRSVPAGFELEAAKHPSLEVKLTSVGGPLPDGVVMYEREGSETFIPTPQPEPVADPEPVKQPRKRR